MRACAWGWWVGDGHWGALAYGLAWHACMPCGRIMLGARRDPSLGSRAQQRRHCAGGGQHELHGRSTLRAGRGHVGVLNLPPVRTQRRRVGAGWAGRPSKRHRHPRDGGDNVRQYHCGHGFASPRSALPQTHPATRRSPKPHTTRHVIID